MRSVWPAIFLAGLLLVRPLPATAIERWADAKLPVTAGLEFWLDAGRENAAREILQLAKIPNGAPLDLWHDASGNRLDVAQRSPACRPHLKLIPGDAAIDFDGKDDSLSTAGARRAFTNLTIFVHTAPRSNPGFFRAFLGLNQSGRNDYQTGLNIDQGPSGSARFENINPEGAGFGGAVDLMTNALPFGTWHTVTVTLGGETEGVRLEIDGVAQNTRQKTAATVWMDEVTVGARCYSNTSEPPHTQGWLEGSIAEILIYNRILSEPERKSVETYLAAKHEALRRVEAVPGAISFTPVADPPPVQMFLPGFTVQELPVQLSNINNLKYRADGKLVALGYNGRIHLLSDSDGDGLEDKDQIFWDKPTLRSPIGLALTPPGYPRGQGVFVAAKGKVSLIVDTNADDIADEEIVVAEGWKELPHGVDALGVALDAAGNVYFGLGTANYADGYLMDKDRTKSLYDLKSERGTILKVSPDFKKREIVCTGIRFPVALAFNATGDLFCTDQEGATWLPNGNPFDELLHILPGRHYGFPPRHPRHLPDVIDEPSVFDYRPQHQSTCGLNFNEPVNGGPVFGPGSWKSDALVCGYSRAKIYRTRLANTAAGYVAQNHLIAALNMLTVDACVSPAGDLAVAVHSGAPDWGSGPDGKGKLYKISYTDKNLPQPVLVYSASPGEIRIAFDRKLDTAQLRDLGRKIVVTEGKYVSAGERFESLRPGYQVVQDQLTSTREGVPVLAVALASDGRTLVLNLPPRVQPLNYAISLPGFPATETVARRNHESTQLRSIELLADRNGVEARWQNSLGEEKWSGWLPHLDLRVAKAFTVGSASHDELWKLIGTPGRLTLRGQIDLWQMLHPAVQPGSQLDYKPESEQVSVEVGATVPFRLKTPEGTVEVAARQRRSIVRTAKENTGLPIELDLPTGAERPDFSIEWQTRDDARPRAFPLRRFWLPWVSAEPESTSIRREIPELAGGNWLRGRAVFFGDQAGCFKCHAIRGEGASIGPDLSNLIHRDYASVLRDIISPNATINPDHVAYSATLRNGEVATGVLVSDTREQLILGLASSERRVIRKTELASLQPSPISLMPEGLAEALGPARLKDLLMFLLVLPLEPAPLEVAGEPPARARSEIEPLLHRDARIQGTLRVVLSAGPKDHGPGEHDYPLWLKRWTTLLGLAEGVKTTVAPGWPTPEQFENADVIVFYSNNAGWSAARARELDRFFERGGGAVYIHYAVDGHENVPELSERIGLAWRGGASKFRHGPLKLSFSPHPLAKDFKELEIVDESYWQLIGDRKDVQLLASGVEEGEAQPLLWTRERGKGRIFVSIPGHYSWTFDDPLFRLLLLRGISWAAHQAPESLDDLAVVGARLK